MKSNNNTSSDNHLREQVLNAFIEGPLLTDQLKEAGKESFPIVRFVSFHNNVVRILVGGKCPGCDAPFLRNLCNQQFANIVHDILFASFPWVCRVKAVLTGDDDFYRISENCGYNVQRPVDANLPKSFIEIMKPMLDQHPNVQSFGKVISKRGDHLKSIGHSDITSWDAMTTTYNGIWMVDDHTLICDTDGNLAHGEDVLNENFTLPQYIIEMPNNEMPCPILMSYNPMFFNPDQYVWIVKK